MNTKTIKANDETECIEKIKAMNLIEPIEIISFDDNLASDKQKEYATDLGIRYPADIDIDDMSILISRYVDYNDKLDPNPELVAFAQNRNIIFNKYIGKKGLYNLIFDSLDGVDKIAFFTFSVYRWLGEDRCGNLDQSPYKAKFYQFANENIDNEPFKKSLNKYKGEELRFFGEASFSGENTCQGGSSNTIAYKLVSEYLANEFGVNKTKNKVYMNKNSKTITNNSKQNYHGKKQLEGKELEKRIAFNMLKVTLIGFVIFIIFMIFVR